MTKQDIENPFRVKGGEPKMAKKPERVFTNEEVMLLNEMVGMGVRILRNKGISVEDPEFQERKKEAIKIVFGLTDIFFKEDQDRMWPSLARRIEDAIAVPPEEYFRRKRAKSLKDSFGHPENEKTQEHLEKARNVILGKRGKGRKKAKVDAAMVRDAVYSVLKNYKYSDTRMKEAAANVLKYYLCVENDLPTNHPDLKRLSDPTRQRGLF